MGYDEHALDPPFLHRIEGLIELMPQRLIKPLGRLVRNHPFRAGGRSHGSRRPLVHAAAQLKGIGRQHPSGLLGLKSKFHQESGCHFVFLALLVSHGQRLPDLPADFPHRIKGVCRILRNQPQFSPPQLPHLSGVQR